MLEAEIINDELLEAELLAEFVEVGAEDYKGAYIITPNFDEQKLETKGLIMRNDVTIHAIPVESVSNSSGGKTIIIGG